MSDSNPDRPPDTDEQSPVEQPSQRDLASRSSRLLAALIDGALLVAPVLLLGAMKPGFEPLFDTMFMLVAGMPVLLVLAGIGIYNLCRIFAHAQTIGKRVMGLQIVTKDLGSRASTLRILASRVAPLAALLFIPPPIAVLVIVIDAAFMIGDDRRCLHDRIAGTNVATYNPPPPSPFR